MAKVSQIIGFHTLYLCEQPQVLASSDHLQPAGPNQLWSQLQARFPKKSGKQVKRNWNLERLLKLYNSTGKFYYPHWRTFLVLQTSPSKLRHFTMPSGYMFVKIKGMYTYHTRRNLSKEQAEVVPLGKPL